LAEKADIARILAMAAEGRSLDEIHAAQSGGPVSWEPPSEAQQQAEVQNQALQEARGRLNSGSVAPGEEPDPDPVLASFDAANRVRITGGGREQQMAAYLENLFAAAKRGDPRVSAPSMFQVPREEWMAQAKARQVAMHERQRLVERVRQGGSAGDGGRVS
jgi:hypothetical protein